MDSFLRETVNLPDGRSYPVVIGDGAINELASLIPGEAAKAAVVTQSGIGVSVDPGIEHRVFTIEDGEGAKRLSVIEELASSFARWGMNRNDVVVAVGGGVVTDVGGFVASCYHRGIRVIHVATTLLGQIDAAIGGKCGVNLDEGKNLVGAFWQPTAVICDTATLTTLPEPEFIAGLGELAKYHFIAGQDLDALALPERVAACVRIKAEVVAADEREGGRRAILNYGHTLAHVLEAESASRTGSYAIRHGEAVAIGLIYAAEIAHKLGRIDAASLAKHRTVVSGYGLATTLPPDCDPSAMVEAFSRDKKALKGTTFVLDGPNGLETEVIEDAALLERCLEALL